MTTTLEQLTEIEGYSDQMEMLERATFDSVAPGICRNKGCDYTCEVEPDSASGYCEECGTNSVVSCLRVAGLI